MIKKGITYFIIITLALYGLRALHYRGLLKQDAGYYGKYKTAFLQENNFDILFLGSSRVAMHFNTKQFDSLTHSNSFNLSLIGANAQVAYAALKAYLLKSNKPKHIFYEVDLHYVKYNTNDIKEFNNYFPFFSNKVLLNEFNKIDNRMLQFDYNPYYSWPYTGFKNMSTSIHGWLNKPNRYDSLIYKGYIKDNFHAPLNFKHTVPYHTFFETRNRNYLDSIISLCKKENIKLRLISSPMFAGGNVDLLNKDQITKQIKNIALINGIEYIDMSSLPFCNQRFLFVDHFHLTYKGAELFTSKLVGYYSNILQKKALK